MKKDRREALRQRLENALGDPAPSEAEAPFYPAHHAHTRKRREAVL
jgi:hypothetical protein